MACGHLATYHLATDHLPPEGPNPNFTTVTRAKPNGKHMFARSMDRIPLSRST